MPQKFDVFNSKTCVKILHLISLGNNTTEKLIEKLGQQDKSTLNQKLAALKRIKLIKTEVDKKDKRKRIYLQTKSDFAYDKWKKQKETQIIFDTLNESFTHKRLKEKVIE